jgi:hypothetical protein
VEKYKSPFVKSEEEYGNVIHRPVKKVEEVKKSRTPFVKSEDEAKNEDAVHRSVKKAKKATFEEDNEESVETEKKMSIPIVSEEGEVEEGKIEEGEVDEGEMEEEEDRDDVIDDLFDE